MVIMRNLILSKIALTQRMSMRQSEMELHCTIVTIIQIVMMVI